MQNKKPSAVHTTEAKAKLPGEAEAGSRRMDACSDGKNGDGTRWMIFVWVIIFWLSAPHLQSAPLLQAKPAEDDTTVLDPVIVSATRSNKKASETSTSVEKFDSTQLDLLNASTPQEVAQQVIGLSASRSPGGTFNSGSLRHAAGAQDYVIRGISGNRILLQSDGIRAPEIFTFGGTYSIGRDYYEYDTLKSIEIVKGATSSLYGSDAIGGVVSYATKDPSDLLALTDKNYVFTLKSGFDSADLSYAETLSSAVESGPVQMMAIYTRRDGSELDAGGSYKADPQTFDQNNLLWKTIYRLDENNSLKLTGEFFRRYQDTDQVSSNGVLAAVSSTQDLDLHDTQERYRLSLEHLFDDVKKTAAFQEIKTTVFYQDTRNRQTSEEFRRTLSNATNQTRFRDENYLSNLFGGGMQLKQSGDYFVLRNNWTYGTEISGSQIERNRNFTQQNNLTGTSSNVFAGTGEVFPLKDIPDSEVLRLGAFAQDEIKFADFDAFTLTPGLRVDYYSVQAHDDPEYQKAVIGGTPVNFSNFSFSPKLGGVLQATKELSLYSQYSQGIRNPTTEDLNGAIVNTPANYRTRPNPNLKEETSHGFEAGVRGNYEPVKFHLAAYYNYYENFIDQFAQVAGNFTPANPTIFQSRNLSAAEIMGTEFKVELPLSAYVPSLSGLSAIFGVAYAEGTDLQNKQPLDSIDPLKLTQNLRYRDASGKWGTDLAGTFVNGKDRISGSIANQFDPGSCYLVDLVGFYKFNDRVTLNLGGYNLTDTTYFNWQDVRGVAANLPDGTGRPMIDRFAQPGVSARASISVVF